ncbi:MAG: class I SAM-dependent methyltransferase [Candidatus Saccharimonadales bacterium]
MSELGPSSFEQPRSMDSPGRNADTPFRNHQIYDEADASYDHLPDPAAGTPEDYDEGDINYDDLPDYGADSGHEDPEFFANPDQNAEHLGSATAEVRHSIHQIEATQAVIAEHTGAHDQDLTDSVDRFLVDHAEHAVDIDASDKAEIVETTLVEGALESTGDRPEGTKNPINELEDQGYDQAVTEGVRKLFEEGATLPNGESAAEVVAQTVISNEMLQSEHYDEDSKEAGWDSPVRAQKLVEGYVTPGSKVLDIGIGTGQAVSGYAEKGATVIGLDRDESMLDAAGTIVGENGQLRQADINEALPIGDLKDSVDVAQAIGVLEFAEDLPAILDQVHGSLKENGVFVFTSELSDNGHAAKSHFEDIGLTVHRHSTDEIKGMLEKSGYTLLGSEAYDGYQREDGEVPYGIFLAQKTVEQAVRPQVSEQLDTALQYYYQGASKEDMQKFAGIDPKEVTEYIRGLPEEEREHALEVRRQALGESTPAPESQELSQPGTLNREAMYVSGINHHDEVNVTEEELNTWFSTLPKDEQQRLASAKQEANEIREYTTKLEGTVEQNLETSAPELLKGRLPQELADRIGSEYVLGLRQLGSYELDEAQESLDADGGVDVSNLSLTQSFNVIGADDDDWTAKGTVIRGYYGVRGGGKFVIAVPMNGADNPTTAYDSVPDMQQDLRSSSDSDHRAVNPKYVAGFIDGEGVFHPNENFMRTNEAKLSSESATSSPSTETAELQKSTNPYERLTSEQLTAVRDNIADSIVQGIRKYDPAEVTRASANLAAIQREIQTRSPEQVAHQRGEVAGEVTYVTEPDSAVIQKIVTELQKIDGAPDIARKLYGGLEIPPPNEQDKEARLQAMEMQGLLAGVSREIRSVTGSEFSEATNPYASMKNEELATTVDRLKQTIQELTAQGVDTTDFRDKLVQAGEVIRGRS